MLQTSHNRLASFALTRLEKQNRDLAKIEINEVLRFVRYIRAEVSSHYAVPGWVVFLVEFFLDVSSNVLQ
jgi:hypothetical protein